jgi:hypothetical protein
MGGGGVILIYPCQAGHPVPDARQTPRYDMMRPSTVSIRSSLAPGAQHPPSAENLAGLNQKKKEVEAVDALQRASALFLQRLEGLADDCEAMADAGAGTRQPPLISSFHRLLT